MGHSNSKKVEEFHIDEIMIFFRELRKECNDRLNIFVCGNNNNLKNLKIQIFKKDIPDIKGKKHELHDWFFNFYDKEEKNVFKEIANDINSEILRNEDNTILIILFNSIKIDNNIIINLFNILPTITRHDQILLLFSFEIENFENNNKNNEFALIKNIVKKNKLDDTFLTNIKIAYYSSDDYSQIINELTPISSYYNNIGDIFNYLDLIIYKDFNAKNFENIVPLLILLL